MLDAPRIYDIAIDFIIRERFHQQKTVHHWISSTTKPAWISAMRITARNTSNPRMERGSSNPVASTTSRGKEGFGRHHHQENL
jgi:hypothetical protein